MPRPIKKLINLEVLETSGVDRAAHLHDGFLVIKNLDAQMPEAESQSKEDDLSSVQEQIDLAVAKAVDGYEEKVAGLEAALEAAKNQAADLAMKLEEIQGMQSAEETSDVAATANMENIPDEVAKSLVTLPVEQQEVFAKAFRAQAEEVAKAAEELRKEKESRLDADAIQKSKETYTHVGIDHDVVAPALRRLNEADPVLAKMVEDVLSATNAQIGESGLLKEFGTATTTSGTVTVLDEAKSLAKSLVESGVVKTIEQGIERVLDTNPDLARRYAQEGAN